MDSTRGFQPNWISAPGDTIRDLLQERDISEARFASLLGLTPEVTDALLQGRSTITIGIARQLESVLGASVSYWISRDFQYRQDSKRLREEEKSWLRQLPLGDMVSFGWLRPPPLPSEELASCLRFFNVSSVSEWNKVYGSLQESIAFRSSPSFDSRHEAVAAWLRAGEIRAADIECEPWRPERFKDSLISIRSLTRQKDPRRFIPVLQQACAKNGVAVVVARSPSGCRASGATRFISNNKAMLQLSFRYLTDDHFWFTFFHEAGHLLLHGERRLFSATLEGQRSWILEGIDAPDTEEELEANEFAATSLIPQEYRPHLLRTHQSAREVIRFAHSLGVSPGVVVGQLQHARQIRYDQLNQLKRRYVWTD